MPTADSQDRGEVNERQRVCPSCRMTISIFATKCRYCGEEVGKPKDETRNLTSEDLGGETIFHRAPSGSVMDALESFRLEENLAEAEAEQEQAAPTRRTGLFNKEATPETKPLKGDGDLPELDPTSQALADAVGLEPSSGSFSSVRRKSLIQQEKTLKERLTLAAGIAVGAIVLLFAGIRGVGWIQDYADARDAEDQPVFVNRAPDMLERGEPPLMILEEAAKSLRENETSENRKFVELAMDRVVDEFNRLVHPERYEQRAIWAMDNLTKASALASRAGAIYPNERTAEMSKEIEGELKAYRMTLLSTKGATAQFVVNLPEPGTETFEKGDIVAGRFTVKTVQGSIVRLEDNLRDDSSGSPREITYQVGTSRPM